jgi:hypothetical protein
MDTVNQPVDLPVAGGILPDATLLESLSKDQLLAYAKELGAKADFSMKKADIMQAIMDRADQAANTVVGDRPSIDEDQADKTEVTPIGTIRIIQGVEMVKVNDLDWVPTIREAMPLDRSVVIISKRRTGKTIYAKTGKPITFDENGQATVDTADWLYLKKLPDFSLKGNQ